MDGLTLVQLTTVAGIATATALVDEIIWRTAAVAAATKDRFGPLVAAVTGVAVATVSGLVLSQAGVDLGQDVVNGVVGGLAAMGIHDLVSSKAGVAG